MICKKNDCGYEVNAEVGKDGFLDISCPRCGNYKWKGYK